MFEQLFSLLGIVDDYFWGYIGAPALIGLGLYFSFKSGWFQVLHLPRIVKNFARSLASKKDSSRGVSPLHAFFASIGGCIGVGNVVGVCTAVQIGGPGAVFWMWVAGLLGMLIKYAEIYLGILYRVKNEKNSYDGGPMIYLQLVFEGKWVAYLFSVLLCLYGVEIYTFRVITHNIATSWHINNYIVIVLLLAAVLFVGKGGLRRVGKVSSVLIPLFLILFSGIAFWIFIQNIYLIPTILATIFKSAFTGHAAIGGFVGSSFMLTLSQGVRRACYTGDIGVGYDSVIHSESKEVNPRKQAAFGIFGIFIDTFIVCTFSVLLVLVTGVWKDSIHEGKVLSVALGQYFPWIDLIWPLFIFLLGYSTVISVFSVGRKAALFVSQKYGATIYFYYAIVAFLIFSFVGEASHNLIIMSIVGMMLLFINIIGMFILRKDIRFSSDYKESE